jgi:AraC-like DNA-binding protein
MTLNWRALPPIFEPALSLAHLTEHDYLFWLGDGDLYAHQPMPRHWHDSYELGLILEGDGLLVIEDREYTYQANQVYVIDDTVPHMCYSLTPHTRLFVVHFQPALLRDSWIAKVRTETLMFIPQMSGGSPMIADHDSPVVNLLYQIRDEGHRSEPGWEVIISGLILQVVGHIARRILQQPQVVRTDLKRRDALERIRPILQLVEERFADPLTLDEMAATAFVSRSYCCALFQEALNTSPIAYRNQRRISEARQLLLSTTRPVREIAFDVGFSSAQEFNRLFYRENHLTPTQFRQRYTDALQKISS